MFYGSKHNKAIVLKLLHSLVFVILSMMLASISKNRLIVFDFFCVSALAALFSLILIKLSRFKLDLRCDKQNLLLYFIRALIIFATMVIWVEVVKLIGINDAMAISYVTPVWLIISAIFYYKEKFSLHSFFALVLNSIAVFLVVQPQLEALSIVGLLIAIVPTFFWAIHDVICKKQTCSQHYLVQAFYVFTFYALVSLPFIFFSAKSISWQLIMAYSVTALLSVANIALLFLAYVYAPIVILVPFSYARIVFAVILSYLFYNDIPSIYSILGATLLIITEFYFYSYNNDRTDRIMNNRYL